MNTPYFASCVVFFPKPQRDKGKYKQQQIVFFTKSIMSFFEINPVSSFTFMLRLEGQSITDNPSPMGIAKSIHVVDTLLMSIMVHSGSTAAPTFLHKYFHYHSLFRVILDQRDNRDHRFVCFAFDCSTSQSTKSVYMYTSLFVKTYLYFNFFLVSYTWQLVKLTL